MKYKFEDGVRVIHERYGCGAVVENTHIGVRIVFDDGRDEICSERFIKKERFVREGSRLSYVQKLLKDRQPTEFVDISSLEFCKLAKRLSQDKNLLVSFSASSKLTDDFRGDYELRAGVPLQEKGNVKDDTLGIKLNVICSKDLVGDISLFGVRFEKFVESDELVVAYGDRAGLWWGLIDLGFRIGKLEDQDQDRIQKRIPVWLGAQ